MRRLALRGTSEVRSVVIVALIVLFIIVGCCDGPNKPVRSREVIYAGAWHIEETPHRGIIYVYTADSLTLLDSLPFSGTVRELVVAPDGRSLFIHRGPTPWLLRVDAKTGNEDWAIEGAASPLLLLDDGHMLVSGRVIRDMQTGASIDSLPDSLEIGYGSQSGTEVAAVVVNEGDADTVVTVLNCATGATKGRFVPRVEGYQLSTINYFRLHPDGVHVIVIGMRFAPEDSWVVLGNVQTGATLYNHQLTGPYGEVTISPDGSLLAVTDPPAALSLDGGGLALLLALEPAPHALEVEYAGGQTRFAADGSRLLIGAAPGLPGGLAVLDIPSLQLTDWIVFPGADSLGLNGPWGGGIDIGIRTCVDR